MYTAIFIVIVTNRNTSRKLTSQQLHTNQIGTTIKYPMMYINFRETSSCEYFCSYRNNTENIAVRGEHVKNLQGGVDHSGLTFYKNDFCKGITPPSDKLIFLSSWLMLQISILILYPIIFLQQLFSTILAIMAVAFLGWKILGSIEWQNCERPRETGGMLPGKIFDLWSSESQFSCILTRVFLVISEFCSIF